MRFFPKPHFRWVEPKPFRRINADFERSQLRWWHKPLGVLIFTAILMGFWLMAHLIPDRRPMPLAKVLPLGLVFSIVYVYTIPWIRLLCPSAVLLLDTHMSHASFATPKARSNIRKSPRFPGSRATSLQRWSLYMASAGERSCSGFLLTFPKLRSPISF